MGKPFLLVENLFSRTQNPGYLLRASSEATGRQVWRLGTGRRGPLNSWRSAAGASAHWVEVECLAPRTVNAIVLDRTHTLAGRQLTLTADGDEVLSVTIPAAVPSGASIDGEAGVVTTEGAWICRFPSAEGQVWRVELAGAAPFTAELSGLWLGQGWQLAHYLELPYSEGSYELLYDQTLSDTAWAGGGYPAKRRVGVLDIRLATHEIETARALLEHWSRRRPMWVIFDPEDAERSLLAIHAPGRGGLEQQRGWWPQQMRIEWVEHEPRPL